LKILEALDAGRPVVATSLAIDGFEDLVGRGVVVANSAEDMADAVVTLLDDPSTSFQLGLEGHRAVSAEHGWDAALAPLFTSWAV
jgi:glycosyltransferase involved in cell wall biosynthesis